MKEGSKIPSATSFYGGIRDLLLSSCRQINMVLGDGNCFFRAISWELLGDQSHHHIIRTLLMDFISEHRPHFSGLTESFGEAFKDHCERLHKMGTWATVTECIGLAAMLHRSVFVLTQLQADEWTWKVYRPPAYPIGVSRQSVLFKIRKLIPLPPYHLELSHISQSHFDHIVPPTSYLEPLLRGVEKSNTSSTPLILC